MKTYNAKNFPMITDFVLSQGKKHFEQGEEIVIEFIKIEDEQVSASLINKDKTDRQVIVASLYVVSRHYQTRLNNEISSMIKISQYEKEQKALKDEIASILGESDVDYYSDKFYTELFEKTFGISAGIITHSGYFTTVYPKDKTLNIKDYYNRYNNIENKFYTRDNTEHPFEFADKEGSYTIKKPLGMSAVDFLSSAMENLYTKAIITRIDDETLMVSAYGKSVKLGIHFAEEMGNAQLRDIISNHQPKS